jgi:hypothetical protein
MSDDSDDYYVEVEERDHRYRGHRSPSPSLSQSRSSGDDTGGTGRSRSGSRTRAVRRRSPDDDETSVAEHSKSVLQICSTHGTDLVETCNVCRCGLGLLRPEIRDQLLKGRPLWEVTDSSQGLDFKARFGERSDKTAPALVLPNLAMELGKGFFTRGQYAGKHFEFLANKYLRVSPEQDKELNANLKDDTIFARYEKEARFKFQFAFRRDLTGRLRDLRMVQRPLLLVGAEIVSMHARFRAVGTAAGITYPNPPPEVDRFGPKSIPNFFVGDMSPALKTVKLADIFDGVEMQQLPVDLRDKIQANHDHNQKKVNEILQEESGRFTDLYSVATDFGLMIESHLGVYFDMYAHVDGSLRELVRNKMLTLFRRDLQGVVAQAGRDGQEESLMGGAEKITSHLKAAATENLVLKGAIMPAAKKTAKSRGNNYDGES